MNTEWNTSRKANGGLLLMMSERVTEAAEGERNEMKSLQGRKKSRRPKNNGGGRGERPPLWHDNY